MLWMRINALAAAALLSLLSTEAVQAQMQNPSMNAQAMMMHHQMINQMDMMRRSQQLQLMARAREAQGHCRGAVQGATGKHCRAAPRKPKSAQETERPSQQWRRTPGPAAVWWSISRPAGRLTLTFGEEALHQPRDSFGLVVVQIVAGARDALETRSRNGRCPRRKPLGLIPECWRERQVRADEQRWRAHQGEAGGPFGLAVQRGEGGAVERIEVPGEAAVRPSAR